MTLDTTLQEKLDLVAEENTRLLKLCQLNTEANILLHSKLKASNAENDSLKEKHEASAAENDKLRARLECSANELPALKKRLESYENMHVAKHQRNQGFAIAFAVFGFFFWAAFALFQDLPLCVLGAWIMLFLVCASLLRDVSALRTRLICDYRPACSCW
jgi:hypothetical protein